MNPSEVVDLFKEITIAYPSFISEDVEKIRFWHQFLKDVPFELAKENLHRHIENDKFPPTIAVLARKSDPNQDYHDALKSSAQEYLAKQDDWRKNAVGPTEEQREKVRRACKTILG